MIQNETEKNINMAHTGPDDAFLVRLIDTASGPVWAEGSRLNRACFIVLDRRQDNQDEVFGI